MNKLCIRLHGRFVEAYLYFDFLWLLAEGGEVWAFDTNAYLSATLTNDALKVATAAFARNDGLERDAWGAVAPEFSQLLARAVGSTGMDLSEEDVRRFSRVFQAVSPDVKSILELRCYYGRGFVATESSVLQLKMLGRSDLQHIAIGGRGNGALGGDKVADFRCRQFRTNLGLISAAAGPDGAWYAAGGLSDDPAWRAKFTKFADASTATEVMGGAMTNIAGAEEITVFTTDIHPSPKKYGVLQDDQERPAMEITRVLESQAELNAALGSTLKQAHRSSETPFKRTFLSKSKIFAVDHEEQIHTLTLVQKDQTFRPTVGTVFPAAPSRILSIAFTANGKTVAELDDEVVLLDLSRKRWNRLFEGEVYSVRGYPGSRWYQNLVTCVGEDRVELTFVS